MGTQCRISFQMTMSKKTNPKHERTCTQNENFEVRVAFEPTVLDFLPDLHSNCLFRQLELWLWNFRYMCNDNVRPDCILNLSRIFFLRTAFTRVVDTPFARTSLRHMLRCNKWWCHGVVPQRGMECTWYILRWLICDKRSAISYYVLFCLKTGHL